MSRHPAISARTARRLFLGAQGLLDDPARKPTRTAVRKIVEQLGFVQVDSINVLARAHDLTLAARLDDYRPEHLAALLREPRVLFEHWTHDASIVPLAWYAHWKPRFRADAARLRAQAWWRSQVGADGDAVVAHVKERITAEGPLRSADFEHPEKRQGWWSWKPQKAALDFLWRAGELAVTERVNFQKVYDLAERVLPDHHEAREPDRAAHLEWACATAAERLVVFTPRELAQFWNAVPAPDATAWCASAERDGRVVRVTVESADDSASQPALALSDWRARSDALPAVPERIRALAPFDPLVRDRARAQRRFGFTYRFEAFTPKTERGHGYYVMPLLEGDRLVGRVDPKLHRERGVLEIRGPWWERGITPTKARLGRLDDALHRMAAFVSAAEVRRVRART